MKKIIPILSIIGLSTLFTGCGGTMSYTKNEAFMNDFKAFQKHVEDYTNLNDIPNTKSDHIASLLKVHQLFPFPEQYIPTS